MNQTSADPGGLISLPSVLKYLRVSRATVTRLMARDPTFPRAIKLGEHRQGRSYFLKPELDAWIKAKAAASAAL